MKRRRAIAMLQEASGNSGWKSRRKQRRLDERATVVTSEGCGYKYFEEMRAAIAAAGGRGWEQKAGVTTRLGAGSERRKGDGREDRNRGGWRRKRRSRERAAAT
ncbi:hypothetical protein B296_00055659 [Ensete ventricosum]|uniref:Uncharacterized protein n=1 Tax=Ensete ventricosum TaxID=4639 RepID=A0A426XUG5_ENSVE|nr:hypothetical protein B296_00055659 [Ensete ventricosum]